MSLTDSQVAAFAADIAANENQPVIDALAIGNNNGILAWYNGQASPAYYLWRTSMTIQEMRDRHFDWAEVVGSLTTNSLLALMVLTGQDQIDPSRASMRGAFASIFAGPQLVNTRTALVDAAKRLATNIQKLFADGDGTEGSPALAVVESISLQDVRDAVAIINME